MSNLMSFLSDELARWSDAGLKRHRRTFRLIKGGHYEIDGHSVIDFASNDYLNLASDSRVVAAAIEASKESGMGARGSALVCGRTIWHERLEECIAEFEGQPAAILFPTGMAANLGTITALVQRDDTIFCDRLNHASLVDGCRQTDARLRVYRHDDLSVLKRELGKCSKESPRWIITDSVFSMDGHLAPLTELTELAQKFEAEIILDEAHGTGVFGDHGRGVAERMQVENLINVRVGTLSKAIGSLGGFVSGSHVLVDYLWNRARSQIYSTALPPSVCAAAIEAIGIISNEPELRVRLMKSSELFRDLLRERGINPLNGSVGPIVPIVLADPNAAVDAARRLEERGFLVGAIRPPTVPNGTSRLRIVISTAHTVDELSALAKEVSAIVPKML